ncbi:hypothetical protein [Acetatifactor muris]|uniref:hypothetical protein n=1 Tax=Acetatifactor muris TaxID=879566 RepID=UPI0023F56520|nr:hypothetical protein [Acetatifactor muris]
MEHTKTNQDRFVILVPKAIETLQRIERQGCVRPTPNLNAGGVSLDCIRELVGHEDERTTFHNYCYNRETDARTHENIERALSRDKV